MSGREHSAEKVAGYPCCRHCSHRALDGVRGGHERPCDCQQSRPLPPGSQRGEA